MSILSLGMAERAQREREIQFIYGNSIAILSFSEPSRELSLLSEIDLDLYDDHPIACLSWSDARLRRASSELEELGWLHRKAMNAETVSEGILSSV